MIKLSISNCERPRLHFATTTPLVSIKMAENFVIMPHESIYYQHLLEVFSFKNN